MLNKPALLVMDEGLSAVDYARKQMIMDHLGRLLPELSTTFVFASHDFEEAVLLSDRVVVLSRETGGIQSTVPVRLPWPRTRTMRNDDECRATVDEIIKAVTS
jgi:NitT/TauT family transport system ATP-binding protein